MVGLGVGNWIVNGPSHRKGLWIWTTMRPWMSSHLPLFSRCALSSWWAPTSFSLFLLGRRNKNKLRGRGCGPGNVTSSTNYELLGQRPQPLGVVKLGFVPCGSNRWILRITIFRWVKPLFWLQQKVFRCHFVFLVQFYWPGFQGVHVWYTLVAWDHGLGAIGQFVRGLFSRAFKGNLWPEGLVTSGF